MKTSLQRSSAASAPRRFVAPALAWLGVLACLAIPLRSAWGAEDGLTWQRRALHSIPPDGYLSVISLRSTGQAPGSSTLDCESEGVVLRVKEGQWSVIAQGAEVAHGTEDGAAPPGFFVKRTPSALLLGVSGRWVYRREAAKLQIPPAVRIGVSPELKVESVHILAREPVRFADDFPDPEPKTGVWEPIRGRWALSSLSFPEQSANPAELVALFDDLEDEASRGRTREAFVGIGIMLGGGRYPRIERLAGNSPAGRAGLRQGDLVRKINDRDVRSATEATALLDGNMGDPVKLTVEHDGALRTLELKRELVIWGRTRRQEPIEPWRQDRAALIATGFDFWTDYRFSCATQTHGVGAFGLVFAYLGPKDYHVFRWVGAAKNGAPGRWLLERIRGGQPTALATREGTFLPREFYAMSVTVGGDALGAIQATCAVDSRTVLEACDDAIVPGRIGLWAEEPGAVSFDDLVVGNPEELRSRGEQGTKNPIQRTDRIMRAWADPAEAWTRNWSEGIAWNKSNFPGDVAITSPLPTYDKLRLIVSAGAREPDAGYALEYAVDSRRAALKRQGKEIAARTLAGEPPNQLTLARSGARVSVLRDGKPWLEFEDPNPLHGAELAAGGVATSAVQLETPCVLEDYFNSSPTHWHVMRGHWEVMNRWVCDPRWSFFGGRSDDLLAMWNKCRLEGNCYFDVHVGVMMFERNMPYENMRDIGVTLCGDGRSPSSGYTAIVGACQNRMTLLLREGRQVASLTDRSALLPEQMMGGNEIYSQHRGWVHIKLTKEKRRVRLYVWDRLVIDYEDPKPLAGGYAGIWTLSNGLLVGKARVAATRLGPPMPFLQEATHFADPILTNDVSAGEARITATGSIYEIANTIGGGPFAVGLRPRVFSAVERPTLSFEAKLSPEVKVDLYFSCQGKTYRVILTGPAEDSGAAQTLGRFEGIEADNRWHPVTFNLGQALRRLYPNDPYLMVWEPNFQNLSNSQYLMAGFGGNRAGATYWLRDIALARAAEPPRLSAAPPK